MSDWLSDVRFVLRCWRRAPGFSATIVVTLVLGLGLASAIFAFADGYLFRPLPFSGADQLYLAFDPNNTPRLLRASDQAALRTSPIADFGFAEWSISGRPVSGELVVGDRRVGVLAYEVSPGFRRTVSLPLLAGRDFTDADHRRSTPVPTWLSHRFWQRDFGGDRGVIGRTYPVLTLSGAATMVEIAGILGPEATSFDLNNVPPDIIVPELSPAPPTPTLLATPIVRLPPDMSREQGEAQIASMLQSVAPASDGRPRVVGLRSLRDYQVAGGRPTARVLFAGAMLVLLLATINLVHLLLTRGVARAGEVATRAALGASRWRLTRLFVTESLLLGAVGVGGGLLLGGWLARVIAATIPQYPTGGRNMALVPMLYDWRTVVFASVLGVIVALAGGLWPAGRALKRSLAWTNRSASGLTTSIPARLSRSILASELAVAAIVMVGTIFIGLGIWRYLNQPLGFDYDSRFFVSVTRTGGQATSVDEVEAAIGAMRGVSGVRAAAADHLFSARGVELSGGAVDPRTISASNVTDGYFETWNLRLRRGRWFAAEEFAGQVPVVVVDEKLARLAWPGDALGQEIRVSGVLSKVVGVIEPRRTRLAMDSAAQVYVPAAHPRAWTSAAVWAPGVSAADLHRRVKAAVDAVVPGADIRVEPVTLEHLFSRDVGEARFQAPIMMAFGVLAFLLAGIGVFGLVSYLVEQRRREFGIRLTLGAQPAHIWRSVIFQSVVPAIAGLAMGVGGAWALESIVRSSVFGWQSSGVGAVSVVVVALLGVAVLAAAGPARRAMRIDPATTLRME